MNYLAFIKKTNTIPTKNNPIETKDFRLLLKHLFIQRHDNEVRERGFWSTEPLLELTKCKLVATKLTAACNRRPRGVQGRAARQPAVCRENRRRLKREFVFTILEFGRVGYKIIWVGDLKTQPLN